MLTLLFSRRFFFGAPPDFSRGWTLGAGALLAERELDGHIHPPLQKLEKEITIVNRFGLHMQPSAMLARTANGCHSAIRVANGQNEEEGKSAMNLKPWEHSRR